MRRDGITGGHVNTHRGQQRIKPGVQHDPIATVNVVLPDGSDGSNLEYHAIVKGNDTNLLQCTANRIRCEGQVFQCGIQVHRCPVVQTNDGCHQHTALQNELLFILRHRKTDKQPLKHIVLQDHLSRDIFLLGNVADLRF